MRERLSSYFERLATEQPVTLAFMLFLIAACIVVPLSIPFYLHDSQSMLLNIVAEGHGVVLDLLIIGWLWFWLNRTAERRQRANRYREEIEDYLGWKSPEAALRIAGNVRRLNRSGISEKLRLTEAHLQGANLAGAMLVEADLWGATLDGSVLREAQLARSNLAGASLEGADLERADLSKSDLRGANLKEADLERAVLDGADVRGSVLLGADLQYASLAGTNLERANLSGANLRGAFLSEAELSGAVLDGANLRGANLHNAKLIDAHLAGADLLSADLSGTVLPVGNDLLAMFEQAKTLFGARFDPEAERVLREAYPQLFELAHPLPGEETRPVQVVRRAPTTASGETVTAT